jgi:hypothetical protein
MDKAYIRSVYRRLWRASHYAIQNRYPAKHSIRGKLRHAFRTETDLPTPSELDNTEQFLRTAGRRRGIENNVIKTLCHVHWSRFGNKYFSGLIEVNLGLIGLIFRV